MKNIVAETKNLKKSFHTNHVLKSVNLEILAGENLVILGKSGSGKSVLIKCLIGLIKPDVGDCFLFNKNISNISNKELNILRKNVGFLFQGGALYDSMSVKDNLMFPLRSNKELKEKDLNDLVLQALQDVGLENAINKMPSELSGGMKKRIGLARTIIMKPELIFFDEPTTGLDPITSKEISELILELQEKYNTTSVIITHDIKCAEIISNKLIVLKDGEIFSQGTFQELKNSKEEWVRSFFN